jgi:DNA-directed RNA polymerase
LLASLPAFEFDDDRLLTLPLTDETRALVADAIVRSIATHPYLTPLLNPPEPWTGFRDGVLAKGRWTAPPLIRGHHPSIENAARYRIGTGQMQPVLDAVNSLQSVPFAINEPVLKFMSLREELRLPELLPAVDPGASSGKKWQHRRKQAEIRSQLSSWELTMAAADFLVQQERFYVPLNIDFRGRLYPLPFFNFTREDRVRALFLFADGLPIGEEGLLWLKAHVAARANGNTWSDTKRPSRLNFNERIAWTENNLDTLYGIGEAVLRPRYIHTAALSWRGRATATWQKHP